MKKLIMALAIILMLSYCSIFADAENKKSIEINIPSRTLSLFDDNKLVKVYPVCVGKPSTPTPAGDYKVIYKAVDPYWIHEGKVVPPGPENPLGIRWIGILEDIGVHGNAMPTSIGTFASGGCIRMLNKDVEELYAIVPVRTPVKIKYDRVDVFDDKYGLSKEILVYPNPYNLKSNKAFIDEIKASGFDAATVKKVELALTRKTSRNYALTTRLGVFLNHQLITCDAFIKDGKIYMNAQAANEVIGLTPDVVKKLAIPIKENGNKVYVNISDAVKKLGGKMEYTAATRNAYITMKIVKVNGVYLSGSCGNFDREYYIDAASLKKLGYDIIEDKVEIKIFGKNIIKIVRNKKASIELTSLLNAANATKNISSISGIMDLKMPTIIKYGDLEIEAVLIDNRLCIKREIVNTIDNNDTAALTVFNYLNTEYIDTAELLDRYSYEANEFFTVIKVNKKEI